MTDLLYHRDAYQRSFQARVVAARRQEVVLDQTAFYATSGGQPSDTGILRSGDGATWPVRAVEHTGGGVVHELSGGGDLPRPGTAIEGMIDWPRRHLHMRGHTALHVLSGVVYHRFHAGTSGGQIGEGEVRMDFRLPEFDRAIAEELVAETNRVLVSDLPIQVRFIDRASALADPSMVRVATHLLPDVRQVRLIDIGGYDVQADGGTHLRSTKEVGEVRLNRIENKGAENKRIYLTLDPPEINESPDERGDATMTRTFDGRATALQQTRWRWDTAAIATIVPGEVVTIEVPDSSTGQLGPESTREDLRKLDLGRVDAAVGPFRVEGAEAGDTLSVELLAIRPGGWGWSAVFRDFGLLRGRWDDDVVIWALDERYARPLGGFLRPMALPTQPMLGWIGVAPAQGDLGMIPPQIHGGNLDNRLHAAGAELDLPVQREGALLMIGDPHALQGDGEVCGTGIETPATVELRVDLHRGVRRRGPRARVTRGPSPAARWLVTEGVGPDLKDAATFATEEMVTVLTEHGFDAKEAYLLLSIAGHLRISEIVDEPNVVVSMVFPEALARLGGDPAASR